MESLVEPARPLSNLGILSKVFRGDLVVPGDARYDGARAVWNGTVDRYPAAIAYCSDVNDVVAVVRFARDHDLVLAVRSGGHSIPGYSVCDFGIVVDLSSMRRVAVDPDRRVARVDGGALLGDLDQAAQRFGLVCPVGAVSHTGVAGLTLGGGLGRLMRRFGLTIDNLRAVELVTADGCVAHASADENPELFWGMRGAGANFGIVTAFEFDLHALDPVITLGRLMYPISRAQELAGVVRAIPEHAPDELVVSMSWGPNPGEPHFPAAMAGEHVAVVSASFAGPPSQADAALRALRALRPTVDTVAATGYLDMQRAADASVPWGTRCYWSGGLAAELGDELLEVAIERSVQAPSPLGGIGVMTVGGAVSRVPPESTAFSARDGRFWILAESIWHDRSGDGANMRWGREASRALKLHLMARNYVNDMPEGETATTRDAYGAVRYERLLALKRAWDPDNVFRFNHNVDPRT